MINQALGCVYTEAGFAYHNKGMLPEAIEMYSMGAMNTAGNPQPFIYMVNCYQTLGDKENEIKSLECAILLIKTSEYAKPWEMLLDELEETLVTLKSENGTK